MHPSAAAKHLQSANPTVTYPPEYIKQSVNRPEDAGNLF